MADMFNALMQGRQAGQQNRLAQLASQSYGAPQESQQSLLSQMAAIDPRAAQAQQGQFQQDEDRTGQQLRGYVEYVNKARASNNPMAVNAALRAGAPLIQRLTGKAAPTEWTPDMDAGWAELEARVAMTPAGAGAGASGVQSTYVDGEGNRVAIMRDGSTQVLGKNDAGATQQTITINGPDGRPAQFTFDRRTGSYVPAGQSMSGQQQAPAVPQGSPATTQFMGPDGMPVQIGNDIPEHVSQQILANPQAFQDVPDGTTAQMPDRPVQQFSGVGQVAQAPQPGSPFVGRRPEDEAAAVEAAKLRTQIGFMPIQQQIETQSAIERATGVASAEAAVKTRADQQSANREKSQALSIYEQGMKGLMDGLGMTSTGWLQGQLPAITAGQQMADGGVSAMAPILKQMFRTAGEGTFTDKDQDLLMAMIPTRSDLPEARAWKLTNIDRIVREKLAAAGESATPGQQTAAPSAPVRINGADDYSALPSGATFIDPQGVTRRKR